MYIQEFLEIFWVGGGEHSPSSLFDLSVLHIVWNNLIS